MGYRTILVGTDGSETAAVAVRAAAQLAGRVRGRLVVATAVGGEVTDADVADEVLRYAHQAVGGGDAEVSTERVEGEPAEALLGLAERLPADLVVVGNVGMGRATRIRLGSVGDRVAHGASSDVLIVHTRTGNGPRTYRRIAVGTDGSPTASEAVRKAFDLAMMLGIGVTVVFVAGDELMGAIALERAQRSKPRALGVETRLVEGDPATGIVEAAREARAELVVVGNKGIRGPRRLLGAVPNEVAHRADTDVLIAKTTERTVEDLAPGHGGLVDAGGRKLAVYRGEDGSLVSLSPRCTHMGCTVDWNDADGTWDCPCHGSRYRADGTVFHGPAERNLSSEALG